MTTVNYENNKYVMIYYFQTFGRLGRYKYVLNPLNSSHDLWMPNVGGKTLFKLFGNIR